MRRITLFLVAFLLAFLIAKCNSKKDPLSEPRLTPHFKGIDVKALPLTVEYVKLAQKSNVIFTKPLPITIGFNDINSGMTVGVCFYGKDFREIEIDNKEWFSKSGITRKTLLFHELTHCLCGRDHDYGDGQEYPSVGIMENIEEMLNGWPFYKASPGRYIDQCPLSIMYPYVVSDRCLKIHEKEYFKEMFNRCQPI